MTSQSHRNYGIQGIGVLIPRRTNAGSEGTALREKEGDERQRKEGE